MMTLAVALRCARDRSRRSDAPSPEQHGRSRARARHASSASCLQLRQQLERLPRRGVDPTSSVAQPRAAISCSRGSAARLAAAGEQRRAAATPAVADARQRRPAAARQLVALEAGQDLLGAGDHRGRQAGQPRHLDAVAAVGAAGDDLAQEDDVVLPLARGDVRVDDARQRVGQVGELVVVRGEQRLRPRLPVGSPGARPRPTRCSGRRRSRCRGRSRRARPGCATVAVCRMLAVSCISTMNVDWPRAMLSEAPTRAKMRSTIGSLASRAGTNEPICASSGRSAVWRR